MSIDIDSTLGPELFDQETLGSELVTNGDFSAWTGDDPDDWTVVGEAGASEASQVGTGEGHGGSGTGLCNLYRADANNLNLRQTILTIGKVYKVTLDVDTHISGTLQIGDASVGDAAGTVSSSGSKIFYMIASSTVFRILVNANPSNITIDNISVKEVTAPDKSIPVDDPWPALADAELISDPTLGTDIMTKGVGWTHDAGNTQYDCDASQAADSDLTENVITGAGLYRVEFTVSNYVAGNVAALVDTAEGTDVSSDDTFVQYVYADSAGVAGVRADVTFNGSIDDISIRPVQTSWTPEGTNKIEIDETEDALLITSVDDNDLGLLRLADAYDLSADFTVGETYLLSIDLKMGAASAGNLRMYDGSGFIILTALSSTSWVSFEFVFTAQHATGTSLTFQNFSPTESAYIRNLSIKAIDAPGTLITSIEGEMIQGIQWVDDDSSVAPMQDGAELILTINGITHQVDIADVSNQLDGAIAWEMEMPQPIRVHSLVVNSLVGGTLYIWTA